MASLHRYFQLLRLGAISRNKDTLSDYNRNVWQAALLSTSLITQTNCPSRLRTHCPLWFVLSTQSGFTLELCEPLLTTQTHTYMCANTHSHSHTFPERMRRWSAKAARWQDFYRIKGDFPCLSLPHRWPTLQPGQRRQRCQPKKNNNLDLLYRLLFDKTFSHGSR